MDTNALKKFAQAARRELLEQVAARLEQVLHTDSVAIREKLDVVNELREQLNRKGKENLIEEVAYTWFNRFCALRYMDVNHITQVGFVSPINGFTQPEILQDAKQGIFDSGWRLDRARVQGLLDGSLPSNNPEQEAYRLLLVAVCNSYAEEMDFLFPKIEDYTELLMPEDLLSAQSVLQSVRETLTAETCQDVEVIGWLYQFYISEKKDEVMAAKGAVAKEDIPAVTQLFTPHWIVRYMVENSLGRLWLLNHPGSKIREQMEYYISPVEEETDYLKVDSPEELKILDPACGSGHILTYAFDLLYAIYEEQGYDLISIPHLILEKNLYGIEIDKRAAMLSSFALMMKAVQKDGRFFRRQVQPNILEMEDVSFTPQEIKAYMVKVGEDLWTQDLWMGLQQFENAKEFGSLIRPVIKDVQELRERMETQGIFEDLFLSKTNENVEKVLRMSEYLSPRYQVVVANPPYMNSNNFPSEVKTFAKQHFQDTRHDLYSMFIEEALLLVKPNGYCGFMTPFSWMNIKSYSDLRKLLIKKTTIESLIKPEYHSFFESAFVPVCTFVVARKRNIDHVGFYIDLAGFSGSDLQPKLVKKAIHEGENSKLLFKAKQKDFLDIPFFQIAYRLDKNLKNAFTVGHKLSAFGNPKKGLSTGNNKRFLRLWYEIKKDSISLYGGNKWYPMTKGGGFRKWYGNFIDVILWENNGKEVKDFSGSVIRNESYYFQEGITWNYVSLASFGSRYVPKGFINNAAGPIIYSKDHLYLMAILNSSTAKEILSIISPTMTFEVGTISSYPIVIDNSVNRENIVKLIKIAEDDWNSFEISWGFSESALLKFQSTLKSNSVPDAYTDLINKRHDSIREMQDLEKENNLFFRNAYGLTKESSPEIPLSEITLSCNPYYRYGANYTEEELEARLFEDTMKEFISYTIGCAFGRYSLDKPGLILANQGETIEDYRRIIGDKPTFAPTETNVIPIVEGEWFKDDAVSRFKQFLRVTFGEENYTENLQFIEDALGKDLEKYFLRDFYKDHVQMYKKRPIYWLFSSPNGSLNALIYMHRYRPDTVSVVLNQYLREYRDKLIAHRRHLAMMTVNGNASARDKSRAIKESESIAKILVELKAYEDEILFPLAGERIEIDLDDGVVVNYAKFGNALKKI